MSITRLKSDESSFLSDENNEIYRLNNSLIAVVNSIETPSWSVNYKFSNLIDSDIVLAFTDLIKIKESERRYYFQLAASDSIRNQLSFLLDRYNAYFELCVSSRCLSGYESIDREILSYDTYDTDIEIYLYALKDEYRTF
jgi:hypothetical protein